MPSRHTRPGWLAAAVLCVLVLAAGMIVYLTGPPSHGAVPRDPPLPRTAYPVPEGAVFASPRGTDSAAGTERDPLRTLTEAVRAADPGDTVVLRGGTYRESVGMIRKRLTIQPFPGERVWLKGSLPVREWEADGKVWQHTGWRDELCNDCYLPEIVDGDHPLAGRPQMVFLNGKPLRQVAARGQVRPGTFYAGGDVVVIGDDPSDRSVEVTAYDHLLQFDGEAAAGSRLRGVGVAHYGSNQRYGAHGAMVVVNAPDVRVERATFRYSASTGLAVFQPGVRVSDSTFTTNGLVGLQANRADRLRVTGSRFDGNNAEHFAVSGEAVGAAGAKVTRTVRPYFADNVFTGNHATGWWCDLGCTHATVIHNRAVGNSGHGMHYEVSSRALIADTVFARNGGHGLKVSSADGVRLYHNTFTENRGGSLGLYNDPRLPSFDPYSESLGLSWLTADLVAVNNLLVQQRSSLPVVRSADYRDEPRGNPAFVTRADANGYLRAGSGADGETTEPLAVLVIGDGKARSFRGLADLRRAGFERHGLTGRPGAVRFAADYTLRPGSAGIDAGVRIPRDVAETLGITAERHPDLGVLAR
ncbi:MAG: right-handed parallel beta-helix repeat-containing protein [Thermocrispum sp.]